MPLDWTAIRLELLQIDAPMRSTLREMRPFFAKSLPAFWRDGAMQEAVWLQLQHWDLIAAGDFGAAYASSVARICEFHQNAGVAPQRYGCRLTFVAEQLMQAVEAEASALRPRRPDRRARVSTFDGAGAAADNSTGLRVSHSTNEEA
jgi:Protoglobin